METILNCVSSKSYNFLYRWSLKATRLASQEISINQVNLLFSKIINKEDSKLQNFLKSKKQKAKTFLAPLLHL
jgi:hypothetical protein